MARIRMAAFLLVLLSMVSVSFGDPLQDAKNAANSLGGSFLDLYGSKTGMKQNVINPMTNSESPMSTMDGTRQFDAQLSCPSSKEFLTVFIQPSATGDLSTVIVSQDTNMDGTTNFSFPLPVPVSGVCANGIISCNAGTWESCRHYGWVVDTSGRAGLTEVALTDLGGCYCINNSCGVNLVWNNLGEVLKDLGGGVAGALQSSNPQFAVSDVRTDGTLIRYYGQQSGACTDAGGGSGVSDPQRYYSDPASLAADTETTRLVQSSEPDSYYSIISNSAPNTQAELRTCRVARVVTFDEGAKLRLKRDYTFIGGWDADGDSKDCFYATGWMDNCVDLVSSIGSWSGCWNNYLSIQSRIAAYINAVFLHNNPNEYVDTVNSVSSSGKSNLAGCFGSDNDAADVYIYANVDVIKTPDCQEVPSTEYTDDRCQALETDTSCQLRDEVVDGIYTYRNFNPTGLSPLPSSKSFGLTNCTRQVTEAWWVKDRTYFCSSGDSFDFTDAQKRTGNIITTATDNTLSMYYQDLRKDASGNWISEGVNSEKACKTRKPKADTQAGISGQAGQYQTSTLSYDFFYKTCVNNSCPLGPGEELLNDCQCIGEFGEAAAVMQTLRTAGRDIICSSGVAKPLQ
jgi:hypothetical protein